MTYFQKLMLLGGISLSTLSWGMEMSNQEIVTRKRPRQIIETSHDALDFLTQKKALEAPQNSLFHNTQTALCMETTHKLLEEAFTSTQAYETLIEKVWQGTFAPEHLSNEFISYMKNSKPLSNFTDREIYVLIVSQNVFVLSQNGSIMKERQSVDDEFLSEVKKRAQTGHPLAQLNLGIMYHYGFLIEQDYSQALTWIHKAAAQENYIPAQYHLAELWVDETEKVDDDVLFKSIYNLAHHGYAPAQILMGQIRLGKWQWERNEKWQRNEKKAFKWFHKAADQGFFEGYFVDENYFCDWQVGETGPHVFYWFMRLATLQHPDDEAARAKTFLRNHLEVRLRNMLSAKQPLAIDNYSLHIIEELKGELNLVQGGSIHHLKVLSRGNALENLLANDYLTTFMNTLDTMCQQYQDLLNQLTNPGFLLNNLADGEWYIRNTVDQKPRAYYTRNIEIPIRNTTYHSLVPSSYHLLQTTSFLDKVSELDHTYEACSHILKTLQDKYSKKTDNVGSLEEGLEDSLNVLKVCNKNYHDFLSSYLMSYLSFEHTNKKEYTFTGVIDKLKSHQEIVHQIKSFALTINDKMMDIIHKTQPYRNTLFYHTIFND